MSAHVIAAVDDDGKLMAAYRWFDTEIKIYQLDLEEETSNETQPLLLKDNESGWEMLSSLASDIPSQGISMISEIYFILDPQFSLRCVKPEKKGQQFIDFDLNSKWASVKDSEKY